MKTRLPEEEYRTLCKAILQRDRWKCRSCGFRGNLHVHHVIFRSQQGPDEAGNLVTVCNACHDGIHKDVKDGAYGLTVWVVEGEFVFVRRAGWKPQ